MMNLRDRDHIGVERSAEWCRLDHPATIKVELSLTVRDCASLWDAAALKGLSTPGMRLADLVDVIGPREDPEIAECIALLAQPATIAGCELEDFDVAVMAGLSSQQQACDRKAA